MEVIKTTRIFYIVYSLYTLLIFACSNYKIEYVFWGLFIMWLSYFAVFLGYKSVDKIGGNSSSVNKKVPFDNIVDWNIYKTSISAIVCWIFAVLSAKYYTGKGFFTVLKSLLGSGNAYNDYQDFFNSSNVGSLSLAKIPYVLMLIYLTFQLCASFLSILLSDKKVKPYQIVYLVLVAMAYYYFGSARGTNFEAYMVFMVLAYCFLSRSLRGFYKESTRKLLFTLLFIFILGVILIFVYRKVVENRGIVFNYGICSDIAFLKHRTISRLMPTTLSLATSIFGYLGFGIFSIGVVFSDLVFNSYESFIWSLIPNGNELFFESTLNQQLRETIHFGAHWVPDLVNFIDGVGLLGLFILLVVFGRFISKCNSSYAPKIVVDLMNFLAFVEMLSLPVGNFLISSTPNKALLIITIIISLYYVIIGSYKNTLRGNN